MALALLTTLVSCATSDSGPGASAGSAGAPSTATSTDGRWAGALAAVPADAVGDSGLTLNDMAAARATLGGQVPDLADKQGWRELLTRLTDGPVALFPSDWDGLCRSSRCSGSATGPGQFSRDTFGFTVADVDVEVGGGTPPRSFVVLEGHFDPDQIIAAFMASSGGASTYRSEPRENGVLLTSDCADSQPCHRPSDLDPLGRDLRAFVSSRTVMISPSAATIDELLATRAGDRPRFVDQPAVGPTVAAVDRAGAYTAQVFSPPPTPGPEKQQVSVEAYRAGAVGLIAGDSGASSMLLVLGDDDAAGASAIASSLEQFTTTWTAASEQRGWSSFFGTGDVEVEGAVVVARYPIAADRRPAVVRNLVYQRALPPPVASAPVGDTTTSR